MNGDPLDKAVRALRDEGDAPAPQAKLTRDRILRDLEQRPRAAKRKWAWAIPLAALLAGSTVLAATGRLDAVVEGARRVLGMQSDAPKLQEATPQVATSEPETERDPSLDVPEPAEATALPETPATDPLPAPLEEPKIAEAVKPRAEGSVHRAVKAAPSAPPTPAPEEKPVASAPEASAAVVAPVPETDDALALYRKAHRLHFVDQNPAAALAAWNAYLAMNPKSPLVVDARYDRALCLVRLGRNAEARAALTPFADGSYGAYRQKDAKALLDAIP